MFFKAFGYQFGVHRSFDGTRFGFERWHYDGCYNWDLTLFGCVFYVMRDYLA